MGKGANFPMKILMLTWEYPPRIVGGIARVVHELPIKMGIYQNMKTTKV